MSTLTKFTGRNAKQLLAIAGAFVLVGLLINVSTSDFKADVFANIKSAPFDGTTLPIKKTPSWVDLSASQWKLPYDQIPLDKFTDTPDYIPSQLVVPTSSLNYKNAADKAIRNAQVTFSTPYMGDYKLDGKEFAGSHLAVDIKIPMGTPVYAIANGVVIKAANEPNGFGNNVVIRHDDVPSANDANVKATYFSGYAHMSQNLVKAGDIVTKGQQIGFSGQSGTATTPHLHFQIDNDKAPWHLYWPYTSKEASDAGLDFWGGVDAGLGKDKALATTINPLMYVQKYRNGSSASNTNTSTNTTTATTPETTNTTPVVTTPVVTTPDTSSTNTNTTATTTTTTTTPDELPPATNTTVPTIPVNVNTTPTVSVTPVALGDLQLKYDNAFSIGAPSVFKVIALDSKGEIIKDYKPNGEVTVKIENGSGSLDKNYLKASDFVNGVAQFTLTPSAQYGIRVSVSNGSISKTSDVIQESAFVDLAQNDANYVAVNFLKNNNVVRGYPDGTFKAANNVSRVEALKFIFEGLNKEVKTIAVLEFKDTDSKAWYARYIASAEREGIVKGYDGNVFKPANAVTKAEFLKMLLEASGMDAKHYPVTSKPYSDVDVNSWYAPYIALAKDKNLLDTGSNMIKPNANLSRGEVAQILYRMVVMKASGKFKYDRSLVVDNDLANNFYTTLQ